MKYEKFNINIEKMVHAHEKHVMTKTNTSFMASWSFIASELNHIYITRYNGF